MRLTATDKAIGEVTMLKADIERAKAFIEKYGAEHAEVAIVEELALMDRCIELLRSVQPAPKPEKAAKVGKPRKSRKSNGAEAEA